MSRFSLGHSAIFHDPVCYPDDPVDRDRLQLTIATAAKTGSFWVIGTETEQNKNLFGLDLFPY